MNSVILTYNMYLFKVFIGASLSEPHTSVTALRTRVFICLSVYLTKFTRFETVTSSH